MKLYLPWLLGKKSNKIYPSYLPAIQGAKVSPGNVFILSILTSNEAVLALAPWQEIK
jgi:hypothetical protein